LPRREKRERKGEIRGEKREGRREVQVVAARNE
jgi:hypothetical protein